MGNAGNGAYFKEERRGNLKRNISNDQEQAGPVSEGI